MPAARPTGMSDFTIRARHLMWAATVAATLSLMMAGCGSAGGGGPGEPSSPSPPPSSGQTPPAPSPPATPGTETTMTGHIIEGVRHSCVVLQVPDRRYVLTGDPVKGLALGVRVSVTGWERPDLLNPCGGMTFVVSQMTRL
jgi:hypothetical protein